MKKTRKKLFPILLFLILLISVGVLIHLIGQEVKDELAIRDMEKETLDNYVKQPDENPDNDPEKPITPDGYVFDWAGMLSINKDVVGWIRFDNPSRINYPIVHGNSNQFYLYHDWTGRYRNAGAIFLHKSNDPEFKDQNSVIYGHRMMGGSMFGGLRYYASQSFMDENPYFYIYTPDRKKRTYEIFAYAQVSEGSDVYNIHFQTAEERESYYEFVKNHAIASRNIDLDEFDTTVTLSTCASRGYYKRMILQGKLISIELNQQP